MKEVGPVIGQVGSGDVSRIVIALFGLAMALRGVRLGWKLRTEPAGDYAPFAIAVTAITFGIGLCAITGAAFRSGYLLIVGACLLLALQLVRTWAARRFNDDKRGAT